MAKDRSRRTTGKPQPTQGLDGLMQVTSFKSWVTLWAFGAVLAAVIVWSVFGKLPERIEGKGVLRGEGGVQLLTTPGEGRITRLTVNVNDTVAIGQSIGSLSAVSVSESVKAAQARYDAAQRAYEASRLSDEGAIADLRAEQGRLQRDLVAREDLYAKRRASLSAGLVTQSSVDSAKRDVDAARSELTSLSERIRTRQNNISRAASQVTQQKIELERTLGTAADASQIKSTVAGRVITVLRKLGDVVRAGEAIAEIESAGSRTGLETVAYVEARTGKRILPGQPVRLTVAGVRPEESGYLLGRVRSVSPFPLSPDAIARVLKETSVEKASYEVLIDPVPDPNTRTKYAWSDGAGPADPIRTGTPVGVSVEVSAKAPITLIFPEKKKPAADTQRAGGNQPGS
jgi:HlyD family secretion protein